MSLMKASVLNDSRNSFPFICKCTKCFFNVKLVNVKRQNFIEQRKLNRDILVLMCESERQLFFVGTLKLRVEIGFCG